MVVLNGYVLLTFHSQFFSYDLMVTLFLLKASNSTENCKSYTKPLICG